MPTQNNGNEFHVVMQMYKKAGDYQSGYKVLGTARTKAEFLHLSAQRDATGEYVWPVFYDNNGKLIRYYEAIDKFGEIEEVIFEREEQED